MTAVKSKDSNTTGGYKEADIHLQSMGARVLLPRKHGAFSRVGWIL